MGTYVLHRPHPIREGAALAVAMGGYVFVATVGLANYDRL